MIQEMSPSAHLYDSTAHVFVWFCSIKNDRYGDPHGGDACRGLHRDIENSVAPRNAPGRLWIRPEKVRWPASMGSETPNGAAERTVWQVIIPRGAGNPYGPSAAVLDSLELLDKWLKQTGFPLRVAVYNNGSTEYGKNKRGGSNYVPIDSDRRSTLRAIKQRIPKWDVEVYTQK